MEPMEFTFKVKKGGRKDWSLGLMDLREQPPQTLNHSEAQ